MTLWDRGARIPSWVAPLCGTAAALALALYMLAPALPMDASVVAWLASLGAIAAAFSYFSRPHRRQMPGPFALGDPGEVRPRIRDQRGHGRWRAFVAHLPSWYKGRSHSGGRPRFD